MTTHATEKKAKGHHCIDGWTKIGNTFLPLDNIARVVIDSEDPLCVCVTDKSGTAGPHLTLHGDEAEALLAEIGYGEDVRKAEKEKAAKAAKATHKKDGKGHSKGDKEDAASGDGEAKGEAGEQTEQPKAEQPAGETQPAVSP